jgi:3'(2'), 5'-bisphosphate nucleotidase
VWIVDPLDGTAEYEERRDDWAVHVALSIAGEPGPGAIAVPGRGLCLDTSGVRLVPPDGRRLRILVSRRRPPAGAEALAAALGADLVPMGSAGAKTAAVLLGEADIYLHAGGLAEWDWVAPVAVARAAGLWCARIDGSALIANRAEVMTPDLLVCAPALLPQVRGALVQTGMIPPA